MISKKESLYEESVVVCTHRQPVVTGLFAVAKEQAVKSEKEIVILKEYGKRL